MVLIIIFCNFIQQQLWADYFQILPHRQAVAVSGHASSSLCKKNINQ